MKVRKKIYLIDVSSLFFRAFYAIRPLSTPAGVPVNAVYGLLSMLIKLLKSEKPEYAVVCYDRKEPSFRKDLYVDYKANRTEMPDELVQQIPYLRRLVNSLGIPSLEVPKFEADDLIGTLTRIGLENNAEVVIVSGDKDFAQLVKPGVLLLDTMKETRLDEAGVLEKWGVKPEQFLDYLAIVGDTSDNIPGVSGLGPKGALKLLSEYGSLEKIYENLDQIKPSGAQEKLRNSQDMAFLSKKLVTIEQKVPLQENLELYRMKGLQREELRQLLIELNFKSFEKSLLGDENSTAIKTESEPKNEQEKNSINSTQFVIRSVSSEEFLLETQNEKEIWVWQQPQGIFFAASQKIWAVFNDLTPVVRDFENRKVQWLGFDLKNIWRELQAENPLLGWDSMLAAYALRAGDCTDFSKIYFQFCGEEWSDLSSPEVTYSKHLKLKEVLEEKLKSSEMLSILKSFDEPLAPILLRMEKRGIKIDIPFLNKMSLELGEKIQNAEAEIKKLAGEDFNVASPKQLGVILFEKMSLPVGKKTKTGYSTDNEVLQELDHPIAKQILEFRELSKLKSTYVDALPQLADPKTHRVHTHFNQALTTTGRLSSTQPNLQNIPIRTERGARVREAFIAETGKKLLSVDYSQIELRVLAHISEDPGLMKAFLEDLDIHTATASEVFSVKLADVTSEQRRVAKAVNFGIAYGQGAFGLADQLGISRTEAQGIIKRYFEKFPGIQSYINETIKLAHEKGYVSTLFGRRRYLDELSNKNPMIKKFGERAAINAPIQGTAADLVKKAMIELDGNCPLKMLLQVHDELVFEGDESEIEKYQPAVVSIMENVVKLKVPLKVNTKS
jgi:DNA polymerase-1